MRMQTMELFTVRTWVASMAIAAFVWPTMGSASAQAAPATRSMTMALASEQARSMGSNAGMGRRLIGQSRPVDLYNASCELRVRQMVTNALAYVIDNDGSFPESAKTFAQSISDESGNVFATNASSPSDTLFSYNTGLAGTVRSQIHDPGHTVLVYEGAFGHLAFRHEGRALIAFVDGHVEELNMGQASVVKWK